MRTAINLFCVASLAIHALAWQAAGKRVYVEPFTTGEGAEKLRDNLTTDLRKLGSITLVASESNADVILAGGGEIWVRGYQSLNPRAGVSPSNGTPIYGGYLAVELRAKDGVTLWSYIVTPRATSGDVSKNLATQIARHVAEALRQNAAPPPTQAVAQTAAVLKGAGATFPYPLYEKWFTNFHRANPGAEFTYDPVGSEAGIRKLLAGEIDFAASDSPEAVNALAPGRDSEFLFLPSAIGAVVPIVNLPGMIGQVAFTPEILASIYLGKITKWNDPALRTANPHLDLPATDITVVHRSDGSGTSYVWTEFLSKTSPEWKSKRGARLTPQWPVGKAAAGNEGVAGLVKEFGGSIGYVEYIYALQQHLSFGRVRNRNGEFVAASLESIDAAAHNGAQMDQALKVSIVDAPGVGVYPISSFTWFVVPAHIPDPAKHDVLVSFLKWMLGQGQTQAAALGYVRLPKDVIDREEFVMSRIN